MTTDADLIAMLRQQAGERRNELRFIEHRLATDPVAQATAARLYIKGDAKAAREAAAMLDEAAERLAIGTERTITRFAWLPVLVDGRPRWLTHYVARQRFTEADIEPWGSLEPKWVTVGRR